MRKEMLSKVCILFPKYSAAIIKMNSVHHIGIYACGKFFCFFYTHYSKLLSLLKKIVW